MNRKIIVCIGIVSSLSLSVASADRFHKAAKKNKIEKNKAERLALKEQFKNHQRDTHGNQANTGKDHRSPHFFKYHQYTIKRISILLRDGKITEEQGSTFKKAHTKITEEIKRAKNSSSLTKTKKNGLRRNLNTLNDEINAVATKGEEGDKRTPIVNNRQNRYEELIEFGEKSGKLSKGEVSRLKRDTERLARTEARLKKGTLSDRERVKLHEKVIELRKKIKKELRD